MSERTVSFFIEDGAVSFLHNDLTAGISLGPARVERASHVEPEQIVLRWLFHILRWVFGETGRVSDFTRRWRCLWRTRIINGPILLPRWRNRQAAIEAEIDWINTNGIPRRKQ